MEVKTSDPLVFEMSEEEYLLLCEETAGICLTCKEITHNECEPDAEEYPCPKCEENQVFSIEELMVRGQISIK